MDTTPAPALPEPSPAPDAPGRRYFGGLLGGLRPGFVISLVGVVAGLLGLVVQGFAAVYGTASILASEPGQRAACAVGADHVVHSLCWDLDLDLSEQEAQREVSPPEANQICRHFIRRADPAKRATFRRQGPSCAFGFKDGDKRAVGMLLTFKSPVSRAALDHYGRFVSEDFGIGDEVGHVIARPGPGVLVYAPGRAGSRVTHEFLVECPAFEITGVMLDVPTDPTPVAVALARRWCPEALTPAAVSSQS